MTCFARMLFAILITAWLTHAVSRGQTIRLDGSILERANKPADSKVVTQDYNFDFEHGLEHWTKSGPAFGSQPIEGASVRTDRTNVVKVGGDYWRNLSYPIGHHGRYLILTDDALKGELTSVDFTLSRATPYFSFLIGGSEDVAYERLELQILVTSPTDADELERRIKTWAETQTALDKRAEVPIRAGQYLTAVAVTGRKDPDGLALDLLKQKSILLPEFLLGRIARLRIIDDSTSEHIGVDFIRFSANAPGPYRPQIWGLADYHTHLTNYIAFGALNGVRTA